MSHRDVIDLVLTGRNMDSAEAERLRLIKRRVPRTRLMDECLALANELKKKDPLALIIAEEAPWRDKELEISRGARLRGRQDARVELPPEGPAGAERHSQVPRQAIQAERNLVHAGVGQEGLKGETMHFIDPRSDFRREVGEWLDRELTDELREEFAREILRVPMAWSPKVLEFNRKLGAKGWVGLHWPKKYGGGGKTLRDQLVVVEELAARYAKIVKFWKVLLAAIQRPDIGEDVRFKDRPERINNFQQLIDVLRPVFAARPRGHWSERLTAHDVPNAPVHSIPEAMQDPEVRHLKLFPRDGAPALRIVDDVAPAAATQRRARVRPAAAARARRAYGIGAA